MIRPHALWPLAAGILMLGGCAPRPVHYYSLAPAAPVQAPAPATGPALLVGRIATPQALQDGRVRYRAGSNEVGAYEYHRWTDPPGIMVRDALIHALRATGKYRAVQEAGSTSEGDFLLRGRLADFSEVDNPGVQTRVSLELELHETKTGRLIWHQAFTHEEASAAKEIPEVVHSLDQNLQTVLREAVAGIDSRLGAQSR